MTAKIVKRLNIAVCTSNESVAMAEAIGELMREPNAQKFNLAMTDEKLQLIDTRVAKQAWLICYRVLSVESWPILDLHGLVVESLIE